MVPLKAPSGHNLLSVPEQEKLTVLVQSYILLWVLLLLSTVAAWTWRVSLYFITIWHFFLLLALVLGYCEVLVGARGTREDVAAGARRMVRGIRYQVDESVPPDAHGIRHGVEVETEPTEITPLIVQRPPDHKEGEVPGAVGWWIAQVLIAVPIPIILLSHVGILLLDGLSQTLADGSSAALGVFSCLRTHLKCGSDVCSPQFTAHWP